MSYRGPAVHLDGGLFCCPLTGTELPTYRNAMPANRYGVSLPKTRHVVVMFIVVRLISIN